MWKRRTFAQLLAAVVLAPLQVLAQGVAPTGERLGLKGYDPVAYFTDGKAQPGASKFEYAWDGVKYRFASAAHRELFKANPDKYAPQFGGSCAMNMSNGVRREADPLTWTISEGKLYVFATVLGYDRFRSHPAEAAAKASNNWPNFKNTPGQ